MTQTTVNNFVPTQKDRLSVPVMKDIVWQAMTLAALVSTCMSNGCQRKTLFCNFLQISMSVRSVMEAVIIIALIMRDHFSVPVAQAIALVVTVVMA